MSETSTHSERLELKLQSSIEGEDFDEVYYYVYHREDQELIGFVELQTIKDLGLLSISNVSIEPNYRGEGLGKELYRLIPSLPLANGHSAQQDGLKFVSGVINEDSRAVWKSLVRDGYAIQSSEWAFDPYRLRNDYEMVR